MEDRNVNPRKIITAAAALPLLGARPADARIEFGPRRTESLPDQRAVGVFADYAGGCLRDSNFWKFI